MNMAQLVMALAFAATLLHGTAAVDLVVGGNTGWTIPPNNTFYSNWASANTFRVGDTLVFNFATGAHDLTVVTRQAYDSCSTANAVNRITNGPARVRLNTTGQHYYICGFPGHCTAGQKLTVNVVGNNSGGSAPAPSAGGGPGTSPTSPGPSGTGTDTTPSTQAPPPSDTAPIGVSFAAVLMFIAVGLFY